MIKLRYLLNEIISGVISSSDIYNFYFLYYHSQHEPQLLQTQYGKEMERQYLTSIKEKYVATFKELLVEQINKYISKQRVDSDFPVKKVSSKDSAETLAFLMSKTFRTDMKRRNDVWNIAAKATADLEKINNPKSMYLPINALNMAIHNTNTLILGKLATGINLERALDACAKVDPKYYVGNVSKDLRDILKNVDDNTF